MSIFDKINKRLSDNLYRHGHYLTDPNAKDSEKIGEMVDDLMEFVKRDARAAVRAKVIRLILRHKRNDAEIDADGFEDL